MSIIQYIVYFSGVVFYSSFIGLVLSLAQKKLSKLEDKCPITNLKNVFLVLSIVFFL